MKSHEMVFLPFVALVAWCTPVLAADPDASAIAEVSNVAYAKAFASGEADALGALYTENAQYTTEDGEVLEGREAIVARARAGFESKIARTISISPTSIRLLAPGVIVEKGTAAVTVGDEDRGTSSYTVTRVKLGDQWLIADVQESALAPADPAASAMASLAWLAGEWKLDKEDSAATTKVEWILDGRFLVSTLSFSRNGAPYSEVEVIGYDPRAGRIRSWVFDSEGGLGQGSWRQEDDKWLILRESVMPDGGAFSSQQIITMISDDSFSFEAVNRMLDDQALPNLDRRTVSRVTAAKGKEAE